MCPSRRRIRRSRTWDGPESPSSGGRLAAQAMQIVKVYMTVLSDSVGIKHSRGGPRDRSIPQFSRSFSELNSS